MEVQENSPAGGCGIMNPTNAPLHHGVITVQRNAAGGLGVSPNSPDLLQEWVNKGVEERLAQQDAAKGGSHATGTKEARH
jgi:hypothetical protein